MVATVDWKFGLIDLEPKEEELGGFKSLFDVWQSKRVNGGIPSRKSFDFYDFHGWHGYILIDEVKYDPFDLKCVLCGVQVAEFMGRDQTGLHLTSYLDDPVEGAHYQAYLDFKKKAVEAKKITRSAGDMDHKFKPYGLDEISFPCGDGGRVTHLISAFSQHEHGIARDVAFDGYFMSF